MNAAIDLKSCSWRYDIAAEKLYQNDLGEYHTYGVRLTTPEHTHILHDVSVSKKAVEHIVELLNNHQVSPVHLYDVVTDWLP